MNEPNYIIVQAGGMGTRMGAFTRNKPKALVSVDNLPIIFHLFRKFSDKKFIIIGDYKLSVFKKYMECFADVCYVFVDAAGKPGTCAGIANALKMIPDNKGFMIIWSDLILSDTFKLPSGNENYIGISDSFTCRWMYENGAFIEEPSSERGVAGAFIFRDKSALSDIGGEGEFVRYLSQKDIGFEEMILTGAKEYGTAESLRTTKQAGAREITSRPFNKITVSGDRLTKKAITPQGEELAVKETGWYRKMSRHCLRYIPKIHSLEPLEMEYINGLNVFEYELDERKKSETLHSLIDVLREVHALESSSPDYTSYYNAYYLKTFKRLNKIRELVPFADRKTITVNGRECRNVFFVKDELENKLMRYVPERFTIIHGDCTFSNIILRNGTQPVLIDPRGYFGHTRLYGDPAYDWAKLYYSVKGNYDQFNRGNFLLEIDETEVRLKIASSGWEGMTSGFFRLIGGDASEEQIKIIHAVIWLSLTTYAWNDYDSICGAFYNGLYHLEESL